MKSATRAHTVPKFYLNGFCAPESDRKAGAPIDPFVWIGSLATGEIKRRSPKNVSISTGLYDGPGGFENPAASIESHLSQIEGAAASAISKFVSSEIQAGAAMPSEILRFLSWQAARTPGWMEVEDEWLYHWDTNSVPAVAEPPPAGFENIRHNKRSCCLEHPDTGERRQVSDSEEFRRLRVAGWKWILGRDDRLEMLHMQAWYFQVRHFPRLTWVRLNAPEGEWFITSDRGVSWIVDGFADGPPAALRHDTAQVIAPLTRKVALVGMHGSKKLGVTPREVNRFIAASVSRWVAGPTKGVVEIAIRDRSECLRRGVV